MRTTFGTLATAALFTALGFGQTDTFYFTQPATPADMTAVTTAIRTVVDLQDIMPDPEHRSLQAHGPVEKLVTADWLFQQLDQPGGAVGSGAPAEYKMFGDRGEAIAVIPLSPAATGADITAAVTAIRTVADIQRLFPYEARKAIVGRGTPEKIAAAEWMVNQVLPYDGQAPTGDSPPYPMEPERLDKADGNSVLQIFRMDPKSTDPELTAMVTAIRTTADLQRLFPFSSGKALIARASPAQVAVAGWMVHEMAKPADPSAVHQTTMPDLIDGVIRIFYVGQQSGPMDVTPLVSQLRSTLGLQRVFPFSQPPAVVLRGRPDQMSTAAALVAKFAAEAQRPGKGCALGIPAGYGSQFSTRLRRTTNDEN
jgi:hypothetical protein